MIINSSYLRDNNCVSIKILNNDFQKLNYYFGFIDHFKKHIWKRYFEYHFEDYFGCYETNKNNGQIHAITNKYFQCIKRNSNIRIKNNNIIKMKLFDNQFNWILNDNILYRLNINHNLQTDIKWYFFISFDKLYNGFFALDIY